MSMNRAVFLDRDGVINRYPGDGEYVISQRGFHFLPRVKKALAILKKSDFMVFIVSNQACVHKGLMSRAELNAITTRMLEGIKRNHGRIDKVYYCVHRKEENCRCRKPRTGMLKKAAKRFSVNIKTSFFIGDTIRDVITARRAGCRSVLVLSGKEKKSNRHKWEVLPDFVFRDLFEAVTYIIQH